jgi:hypothetical protein
MLGYPQVLPITSGETLAIMQVSFFVSFCSSPHDDPQMGIVLGKETAELILVHQLDGQLHSYSRNSANINLTGTRLNELPEPHAPNVQVRAFLI